MRVRRNVIVIGIGAGNPDYVTVQAVNALNRASVFFIPEKGGGKEQLARLRRDICERFIENRDYRMVTFDSPGRPKPGGEYRKGIETWRGEVERVYERLLADELGEDECGAFLVWGDPSLYDGTLRILESIRAKGGMELEYDVVPGITSVQALAARHKVPLNRIGEAVTITTGRRLSQGFPEDAGSVVVMLDGNAAFTKVEDDIHIHWGAYVGTPDEILVSGNLEDVAGEIELLKKKAQKNHGWIMDTYLLTRPESKED